jgi:cell division protein FtsZ
MSGARGLLINITGGDDMTLFEVDQAANRIREEVDEEANIIFGSAIDDTLQGKVRVSVVATGIETPGSKAAERPRLVAVGGGMPQQQAAVGSEQAAPMQQQPQPMMQSAPQPVAVGMQSHSGQPPMMRPAVVPGMPQRPVPQLRTPPMHQAAPMLRTAPPPVQAAPMPQPEMERVSMPQPREETYEQEPVASAAARPMQPQPRPAPSPARTTSRFAEPRVAGQRSGMFAEPSKTEPPPPRKSLFGIVTGAIRGTPVTPAEPAPQPAPRHDAAAAERQEQVRANVRPTGGDEMGIDIPAFLRRQSS